MTLVFLHVPKAGGNSMLDFLLPNFSEEVRFDVNQGLNYVERLKELSNLDDSTKRSLELVYGHLPYGVHQWLPQECQYFTVLRDPVDRVASHYYYVKEQPTHPLFEAVVGSGMTLAEYATSDLSGELSNGMTRLICGREQADSIRGHAACRDSDLNEAIEHLDRHFAVVGLLEKLPQTYQVLSKEFGWPRREVVRKNKTRQRKPLEKLDRKSREAIVQSNEMDLELYRWAKVRFEKQCTGLGIDVESAPGQTSLFSRLMGRIRQS